jgi:hypothetical protein
METVFAPLSDRLFRQTLDYLGKAVATTITLTAKEVEEMPLAPDIYSLALMLLVAMLALLRGMDGTAVRLSQDGQQEASAWSLEFGVLLASADGFATCFEGDAAPHDTTRTEMNRPLPVRNCYRLYHLISTSTGYAV